MLHVMDLGSPVFHVGFDTHHAGFLADFAGKAAQKEDEHDHTENFLPGFFALFQKDDAWQNAEENDDAHPAHNIECLEKNLGPDQGDGQRRDECQGDDKGAVCDAHLIFGHILDESHEPHAVGQVGGHDGQEGKDQ